MKKCGEEKVTYRKILTNDMVKRFLNKHGYNWVGIWAEFNRFTGAFWHTITDVSSVSNRFIYLGNANQFCDEPRELKDKIILNPRVKYLEVGLTSLKISTPYVNPLAVYTLDDEEEPTILFRVERDLSEEWIKYLIDNVPEYLSYMKKYYETEKEIILSRINKRKSLIVKKIEELNKEKNNFIKVQNEETEKDKAILVRYENILALINNYSQNSEEKTT